MLLVIQKVNKEAAICIFSIKKLNVVKEDYKELLLIKIEYERPEMNILQDLKIKDLPVALKKCPNNINIM